MIIFLYWLFKSSPIATFLDVWIFHNDKYCPNEFKYDHSYSTIKDAKTACSKDNSCGYVYDWRCDNSPETHKIGLCKKFPNSQLRQYSPDCVYEISRGKIYGSDSNIVNML